MPAKRRNVARAASAVTSSHLCMDCQCDVWGEVKAGVWGEVKAGARPP